MLSLLKELLGISPQPLILSNTINANLEFILTALKKKMGIWKYIAVI